MCYAQAMKMTKLILIICFFGLFKFSYSQQKDSAFFVGINIAPIFIAVVIWSIKKLL